VAAAVHVQGGRQGKRSVYTCPIKALGEREVASGLAASSARTMWLAAPATPRVTHDADPLLHGRNPGRTSRLREGSQADVQEVIMDEFHYYADPRERGVAWQIPLLDDAARRDSC